MVLSNKKLKQKLRASKVELLAASEVQIKSTNESCTTPEVVSKSQESLKSLLNSVTQKSRLSKREKKRRVKGTEKEESDGVEAQKEEKDGGSSGVSELKKVKNKKRKRDESEGLEKENVGLEKNEKTPMKKKNKKKKKKKKKSVKKKKLEDEEAKEEVNTGDGGKGEVVEAAAPEPIQNDERQESEDASKKVYVGGIPYYSTEDDIRSFFEGCGTITELDCMIFPDSGKFRGIAIISFKTEAAAKRALVLDGSDMGGLFLKIQSYKSARTNKVSNFSPKMVDGYNRIYIGNLSWDITEDDLKKLFVDCSITSIRFGEDKETGEFRGYGHVDFADSVSLNKALKLDQKIVCGRPIKISCAVRKEGTTTNSKFISKDHRKEGAATNSKSMPKDHGKEGAATNSKSIAKDDNADSVATSTVSEEEHHNVDIVAPSAVSAKIRRRTCYECGERGHLSSSCPKKQAEQVGS